MIYCEYEKTYMEMDFAVGGGGDECFGFECD